jgi:hypothetical protein
MLLTIRYPGNPLPMNGKCPCSSCQRRREAAAVRS